MSRTLLWIFCCFGIVAGAAVMAISFQSYAEGDVAIFLRLLGVIAWGISAYYYKLILDARRLQARRVEANDWPWGLQIYCDPRLRKQIIWVVVWIIAVAIAKLVLHFTDAFS